MGRRRSVDQNDNQEEPPCYSCIHAVKRGPFRLCNKGKEGYKHIGKWTSCDEQEVPE